MKEGIHCAGKEKKHYSERHEGFCLFLPFLVLNLVFVLVCACVCVNEWRRAERILAKISCGIHNFRSQDVQEISRIGLNFV